MSVVRDSCRVEMRRQWISGLAITLTALVCLYGFWRLSPETTFVVAWCFLVILIVLFWFAGKQRALVSTQKERPSVEDAKLSERERCAKIVEEWLTIFGNKNPLHVSAQTWANDAAHDILEAIRSPLPPPPAQGEQP